MSDLDLVQEARKTWWEIVESDEGECRLMGIVRELADEVERLRKEVAVLEEEYGQPLIAPDVLTKEAFARLGENLVPNPLWGRKV